MSKIAKALTQAATDVVADRLQSVANATTGISEPSARTLAQEAVRTAVASPAVQNAIEAATPKPISMFKSQALWGAVIALAPNLIILLGKYFDVEVTEGQAADLVGQITALVGGLLALYGRITTTRPIAGTAAAAKVQNAAS